MRSMTSEPGPRPGAAVPVTGPWWPGPRPRSPRPTGDLVLERRAVRDGQSSGRLTRRGGVGERHAGLGELADDRGAPAGLVPLLLGDDQPPGLARPTRRSSAMSSGRSQRRSMTSASMPSAASFSAAASARSTISSVATIVTSRTLAHDRRLADLGDRAALDGALAGVERLVLEEDHRVVARAIAARSSS